MDPTPNTQLPPGRPQRRPRQRYQFGLWLLFILTTMCAAVLGLVRQFETHYILRVFFAFYLIAMGGYVVLRFPYLLRATFGFSARLREIQDHRRDLAAWAEAQRTAGEDTSDKSRGE